MLKTEAEISRIKGCSRQAVNKFLKKNNIQPSGKKGKLDTYDCTQKPLAGYLAGKAPAEPKPRPPPERVGNKNKKPDKFKLIINEIVKSNLGVTGELAAALFNEALEMARKIKTRRQCLKCPSKQKKKWKMNL
jgi:hypothetical protein